MPITFACAGCAASLTVSDAAAGRSGKCPHCQGPILVPAGRALAQAVPQAVMPASALPIGGGASASAVPANGLGPAVALPNLRIHKDRRWVLLGVAAVALLVFLGLLSMFFMGSSSPDAMRYLPDDFQVYMTGRYESVSQTPAYKEMDRISKELNRNLAKLGGGLNNPDMLNDIGIKQENMRQITAGMSLGNSNMPLPDMVMVIELAKAINPDEIRANLKKQNYAETKVETYTVHTGNQAGMTISICVLDSKTVLFAMNNSLRDILTRNRPAKISDTMKTVMKQVDRRKAFAMGIALRDLFNKAEFKELTAGNKFVNDLDMAFMDMSMGDDIDMNVSVVCKTKETADELRKMTEGVMAMGRMAMPAEAPKEMGEFIDALKFSTEGNRMVCKAKLKTVVLSNMMKKIVQNPLFNQ